MRGLRIRTGCVQVKNRTREFCTISERKPGVEAQVDMGELWLKDMDKEKVKVYFFAMVLSYSRMKYVYFSINPFNTGMFCYAHDRAFRYFGGRPKEIWYDQDKIMVVSVNCGEIIFTNDFDEYRREVDFEIYLCKKQDPDTKGKIENIIRYVKENFLSGREYCGIDSLNSDCLRWLDRTGNGTLHASTRRVPRELFEEERNALIFTPPRRINLVKNKIVTVNGLNTILYKSNRYSLPAGKYHSGDKLRAEVVGKLLQIIDPATNEVVITHRIQIDKGKLATLENNGKEEKDKLTSDMKEFLRKNESLFAFMRKIADEKPRYVVEQYHMLKRAIKKHGEQKVTTAVNICIKKSSFTVNEVVLILLSSEGVDEIQDIVPQRAVPHYKKLISGLAVYNLLLEDDNNDG